MPVPLTALRALPLEDKGRRAELAAAAGGCLVMETLFVVEAAVENFGRGLATTNGTSDDAADGGLRARGARGGMSLNIRPSWRWVAVPVPQTTTSSHTRAVLVPHP